MNRYILGVIGLFFHFGNAKEPLDKLKLNALNKKHPLEIKTVARTTDTDKVLFFSKPIDSSKFNERTTTISVKKGPDDAVIKTTVKDIITYYIFFDGRIEKHIPRQVKKENENKYNYIYFDRKGKSYDLGAYSVKKIPLYRGEEGEFINLINLEEVPKYFKIKNYQYHFNIDSKRSFVNEQTLASFFGAMLEVNFLDISCNGFSHSDGSSKPSKSHINGNNGDFKYLRKDQSLPCGKGTSLNIIKSPDSLDYVRQNKWNNALYKFGWKGFLGWTLVTKGKKKYLNHVPKNTANHYHHIHVQEYEPNFKEIRE